MLKSTHKPSAAAAAPSRLAGQSTRRLQATSTTTTPRPRSLRTSARERSLGHPSAAASHSSPYSPYPGVPSLADPNVANAYLAQFNQQQQPQHNRHGRGGHGSSRGGFEGRPRPQPIDKPRRKEAIPGCEPWILVYTKYSRRFVYNPEKKTSYWRIPEKLMPGILELDKARIRQKATGEYEEIEVEVTDDEGEGADGDGNDEAHRVKRQRIEDAQREDEDQDEDDPVEFTEADIALQLQAMGDDYDLEPGDYDDGNAENWPEGAEGVAFTQEDAKALFKDLLNDFNINPYSPWDKLVEEGKIIDDMRYTALPTMKARKDCFDEWSRDKIAELKEQRARQEKKDPRIAYMAFLQEKATPKLYWPEFKRKFKKEAPMKDLNLSDKDREKAYREHISRLKMPRDKLKADLTALLKAQPAHLLHGRSLATGLPTPVLVDLRYISLEASVRDPLIEAFVSNLPPPPEDPEAAREADEGRRKAQEARERRERALEERNRLVDEQRERRERDVRASKARLREEEREIEMAMRVGKGGLQGQLASMQGESAD